MHDLTAFQRDLLRCIASMDDDEPHGLGIKDWLEAHTGYEPVHHGRLYPNLDALVDKGLVRKGTVDRRTNSYHLTERGRREISEHVGGWVDAADAEGLAIRASEESDDLLAAPDGGDD